MARKTADAPMKNEKRKIVNQERHDQQLSRKAMKKQDKIEKKQRQAAKDHKYREALDLI